MPMRRVEFEPVIPISERPKNLDSTSSLSCINSPEDELKVHHQQESSIKPFGLFWIYLASCRRNFISAVCISFLCPSVSSMFHFQKLELIVSLVCTNSYPFPSHLVTKRSIYSTTHAWKL